MVLLERHAPRAQSARAVGALRRRARARRGREADDRRARRRQGRLQARAEGSGGVFERGRGRRRRGGKRERLGVPERRSAASGSARGCTARRRRGGARRRGGEHAREAAATIRTPTRTGGRFCRTTKRRTRTVSRGRFPATRGRTRTRRAGARVGARSNAERPRALRAAPRRSRARRDRVRGERRGLARAPRARRRRAREMARRRAARHKRRRLRATDEAPPDALAARIANEARRLEAVPASSSSLTAAASLFARAVKRVLPFYRAAADRTLVGASLDDAPCASCGSPEDAASFVLCDGCPNGGHARCMGMRGVPEGDWWCPACVARADVCGDKSSDEPNGMHTSRREPAPRRGALGRAPALAADGGRVGVRMRRRGRDGEARVHDARRRDPVEGARSRRQCALLRSLRTPLGAAHSSVLAPGGGVRVAGGSAVHAVRRRGRRGGVRALRAVPERGALRVSGDAGAARGGVDVRRVRGGRGEGNEARGEMSETREVDACMGGRHFFVTSGVAETTQEGSFAPSADRPTWRAPADPRALSSFVASGARQSR